MAFKRRAGATKQLANSFAMRRHLLSVAGEGADEVRSRLPHPNILGGLTVSARPTEKGAEVVVNGSGWHLWEYGTSNHGARPAIRPGVQIALSRRGGKFRPQ